MTTDRLNLQLDTRCVDIHMFHLSASLLTLRSCKVWTCTIHISAGLGFWGEDGMCLKVRARFIFLPFLRGLPTTVYEI